MEETNRNSNIGATSNNPADDKTPARHWYIAIVANNTEMVSAEHLSKFYEVFVASQKVVSVWKDGRRKVRDRILLRGKVLIRCTEQERMDTFRLGCVKRYMVDIASTPNEFGRRKVAIVPDYQVDCLKFILKQDEAKVEIDNENLQAGERVRMIRGAFAGLEGVVINFASNKPKIYIRIDHLGCASLEIDVNDLERIG